MGRGPSPGLMFPKFTAGCMCEALWNNTSWPYIADGEGRDFLLSPEAPEHEDSSEWSWSESACLSVWVLTFSRKQLRDVSEDELHHNGLHSDFHEGRCAVEPRRLNVLGSERAGEVISLMKWKQWMHVTRQVGRMDETTEKQEQNEWRSQHRNKTHRNSFFSRQFLEYQQ